ncbi:GNAT family N-acetyltransferase [Oceaniglobus ichthyenteri]|uniref:GNAT family N-acetyltransferase n=1 Tax=Oceaniglobus ichthyenteri TaxID=2136177 RepID=UPI000D391D06|nr:GNAT family N-acetyltransferase [Oceaniglobus ichthyenteri]
MTLIIRPLTADDRPDWERLWTAYLAHYDTTLPDQVIDTTFGRLIGGKPHDYNGLLAVLDGKPVGLSHYLFHRHGWKTENVCYLQDLYADPAVRGTGVGRALIQAVYDRADAAGAPSVYWLTQEFNTQARKLYDRIGTLTPFIKYARP